MKRRALTATTVIIALTAAMLFAGVVNAQPATATAQNIAHTPQDVHGTTPQVLGKDHAAGNDASTLAVDAAGTTMADVKLKPAVNL